MKSLRILLVAGLVLLPFCLGAQTRSETSLYNKTIKKLSVKSADKFLKKYPNSVYAPKVLHLKDSLLLADYLDKNVSRISREDALAVAGDALDAIGWKKDGAEHVLALDKDLSLRILSPDGSLEEQRGIPVYTMEDPAPPLSLALPLELIEPLGARRSYLHFAYRGGNSEYVEVLYRPEEDLVQQALFYGTPLQEGRIEGQSPEMMEGLMPSAEQMWLVGRLRENPSLIPLSKADLLTDGAIRWWLDKNPKAQTTASKLSFGRLDPESSLVEACKKARKEKGKSYSVAQLDIRGYTVLCAVKGGEYSLIWCEPVCRNRATDPYIKSFYFENDGTTLDVVYYKGKTTFKNKISLASQGLWHLK